MRVKLLETCGLTGDIDGESAPFTARQLEACQGALSELAQPDVDRDKVAGHLRCGINPAD